MKVLEKSLNFLFQLLYDPCITVECSCSYTEVGRWHCVKLLLKITTITQILVTFALTTEISLQTAVTSRRRASPVRSLVSIYDYLVFLLNLCSLRDPPCCPCIIVTWWSGSGGIQAWSWRPTGFLQCFDTVGLVIWSVKIVPEMTYYVSSGTLSLYTTIVSCQTGESRLVRVDDMILCVDVICDHGFIPF